MCGSSDNQTTKTKCMDNYKHKAKVEKQRKKKKRDHKRICLPSSVQIDLFWGREQPSVSL